MKPLALVFAALSLLAGCGEEKTASPPEQPPTDGPLVVFTRGGGYAYQPLRLEVDREGKATLTTGAGPKNTKKSFTLSPDDRATLDDALEEAKDTDGPGNSPGCADCFLYAVKADGVDFQLDSVTYTDDATPAGQVALVAILEELAAR